MNSNRTVPEVAEFFRCNEKTVRRLIKSGELAPSYIGGKYLFTQAALDAYMAKKVTRPATGAARGRRARRNKDAA